MVKGKKTKFVDVKGKDSLTTLLPGRERCECQAALHPLVNNCLFCGRIVCLQEGAGPCFYCGEIVLDKAERAKVMSGNTKEAQLLLNKYSKLPKPSEAEDRKREAEAQKERLLEYDKNGVKRTHVIDDQSDYFAVENPWLSDEERKVLTKKKEEYMESKNRLKRQIKVTIDFAGRRVIEQVNEPYMPDLSSLSVSEPKPNTCKNQKEEERIHIEPKFVGTLERASTRAPTMWSNRIQDAELQEMVDAGNCLSVQQPYASMIMEGIKIFEGRTWYTPVRGRLWIHASKKPPTPELLQEIKATYAAIVGEIEFPENFPLGCLLGCVDFLDCMPQEEYLQLYPNGEVADPYVFVLANPRILPVKLPMNGKLKIFKLEQHIHQAAKRALEKKNIA